MWLHDNSCRELRADCNRQASAEHKAYVKLPTERPNSGSMSIELSWKTPMLSSIVFLEKEEMIFGTFRQFWKMDGFIEVDQEITVFYINVIKTDFRVVCDKNHPAQLTP